MFKKAKWRKAVKKARKKRTEYQKLKKNLDILWSLIVKQEANNVCVYPDCNKTTYLNSHHIFGKINMATRWDLENGLCLCCGHHTLNTFSAHQSPDFIDWIKGYIGKERYQRIMKKSYTIRKWSIEEMKELLEEFKKEIK